ncbi:TIGR00153 family protein [Gammaproteobacteria bacterium]|jgi:uncharacterized protein|nr:TIGR00153 family protein [Gammaproteobacteria bacterium]
MIFKTVIHELIQSSPFQNLQKHMKLCCQCVDQLEPFFTAMIQADFQEAQMCWTQIQAIENEADDLKSQLRLSIHKRLYLPIDRPELLSLIKKQDLLANTARNVAGIAFGRKMAIPSELQPSFIEYLRCSISACHQANLAIDELIPLLNSVFSKNTLSVIEKMLEKLQILEHETDVLQVEVRRQLFQLEHELSPVNIFFLYKTVDQIGLLSDEAKWVGDQLLLMVATK